MKILNCSKCANPVTLCHCTEDESYTEALTMIGGPGKFEGEGVEVAYFYLRGLDGDGESLWSDENGGGSTELFDVNEYERKLFSFKANVTHFIITEDSQGFVSGEELTDKQTAAERAFAENLYSEESEAV